MPFPYVFLTALYCLAIFSLSAQSHPAVPEIDIPLFDDLVAHAILYGGLCAVVSMGIRRSDEPQKPRVQVFAPIAFAVFYGLTDEFHQLYVPDRSADVWDVIANFLGAATVQVVLCGVLWRFWKHSGLLRMLSRGGSVR